MNLELCEEALEYGRTALHALESAGGDQIAQMVESSPDKREELVAPLLSQLGAWDLNPRGPTEELEAAAAMCRAAGWWAVPYPVAERLARPGDVGGDGLIVVGDRSPAAAVAGLELEWTAVTLDGRRSRARARPNPEAVRKTGFVTGLDLEPLDESGMGDVALGLILPCWTLLGMLDRAMHLTCGYVQERQQFGQPLSSFQGVQFQLTDAEVERLGLEELAKYALWSVQERRQEALADALALRLAAIEAADVVFRVTHQLHGAIGFCDETVLSWISRYSVPLRRLPFGLSATRRQLTERLGAGGLSGLFA